MVMLGVRLEILGQHRGLVSKVRLGLESNA
jgi:hypothetical protein